MARHLLGWYSVGESMLDANYSLLSVKWTMLCNPSKLRKPWKKTIKNWNIKKLNPDIIIYIHHNLYTYFYKHHNFVCIILQHHYFLYRRRRWAMDPPSRRVVQTGHGDGCWSRMGLQIACTTVNSIHNQQISLIALFVIY